jgi:hypothetical protein
VISQASSTEEMAFYLKTIRRRPRSSPVPVYGADKVADTLFEGPNDACTETEGFPLARRSIDAIMPQIQE